MPLDANFIANVQGVVLAALKRAGMPNDASDKALRAARERIGLNLPTKEQRREYSQAASWEIHVWESEGGFSPSFLEIS